VRVNGFLAEFQLHFLLVFGVFAFACSEPWSVAILQILIALLLATVVWGRNLSFSSPALRWFLPGILGLVGIGLLQLFNERPIIDPHSSLLFTTSAWATKKAILLWLSYAGLLVAAASIVDDPVKLKRLAWSIFLLGVVVAITGLAFKSERTPLLLGFRPMSHATPQHFGPFVNRDHAASFLAMCGMVGWGILFSHIAYLRDAATRGKLFDRLALVVIVLGMIATIAFCIVNTGSRGGTHSFFMASWLIAAISAALFSRGLKRVGYFTVLLASCGGYAYLLNQFPLWRGYVDGKWIASLQWRVSMYKGGFGMLSDFPVFGAGLGAFSFGFPPYQEEWMKGFVRHIHSDWLQIALETGVVGLVLFAGSLGVLMFIGLRRWIACPSREIRALIAGVYGALIAASIHMFLEFPFQMPGNAAVFVVVAAFLGSRALRVGKDEVRRSSWVYPRWVARLSPLIPLVASWMFVPPIVAEVAFYQGKGADLHSRVNYLTRALRWDENPKYAVHLGLTYLKLVRENRFARSVFAQRGLEAVEPYYRRYPVDPNLQRVYSGLLRRAGGRA